MDWRLAIGTTFAVAVLAIVLYGAPARSARLRRARGGAGGGAERGGEAVRGGARLAVASAGAVCAVVAGFACRGTGSFNLTAKGHTVSPAFSSIQAQGDGIRVIVLRDPTVHGNLATMPLAVNGVLVAHLGVVEYCVLRLPPGEVELSVPRGSALRDQSYFEFITLEPDREYAAVIRVWQHLGAGEIVRVPPREIERCQRCRPVSGSASR